MQISGYDIIGDIHGCYDELHALLTKLGYSKASPSAAFAHPERKAIFLGDLVDRGPAQVKTILTVKAMIENGTALSIMGNHEFNAICYATPNPTTPGDFLRTQMGNRGRINISQHVGFLAETAHDLSLRNELLSFFKTLPLWLELEDIRIIHACWNAEQQSILRPYLTENNCLTDEGYIAACEQGNPARGAAELLLKGLELPLPDGACFHDIDGHTRQAVRIKWWDNTAADFAALALLPAAVARELPHVQVPDLASFRYNDDKLLFVGHYWLAGTPCALSSNVICVDYSVAKNGKLVAYRHNFGAPYAAENFVTTLI